MLLAFLAIWTNADYSWPKTLVLCRREEMVWCRQPIGAHGAFVCVVCGWHWSSCESGEIREVQHFHTAAPKVGPHARACAHTRPRHRRGVGERPHVRWSVEGTASLAVAEPRCSGGQGGAVGLKVSARCSEAICSNVDGWISVELQLSCCRAMKPRHALLSISLSGNFRMVWVLI